MASPAAAAAPPCRLQHRNAIPTTLAPSLTEQFFCTYMSISKTCTGDDFLMGFRTLVVGTGRVRQGAIIVNTQNLGVQHLHPSNLTKVKQMYQDTYDQLRDTVHASVIIVTNPIIQTVLEIVLRIRKKSATEVIVVGSEKAAFDTAERLVRDEYLPALATAAAAAAAAAPAAAADGSDAASSARRHGESPPEAIVLGVALLAWTCSLRA